MILRYKEFYDQKIHFSILLKDEGKGGIIFRWIDLKNYYFLEIFS